MDELFFGVKRKKPRSSPHRRRSSPHRRRNSPKRRHSPRRRTTMCRKKLSLPKLRKLALEHNINIFSEAKTAISKRTGMPKKPKLVGCSTLMKRLDEAGLSNLYKTRSVSVDMNMPGDLFMESQMVDMPGMPEMPGMQEQSLIDPDCNVYWSNWSNANARKAKGFRGIMKGDGDCATRAKNNKLVPDEEVDTDALAEEAGFDMSYGRHYSASARPRLNVKQVGSIEVKGRTHHVFKGSEGGLFYLKGKTGRKVYISKERLRRK